MAEVDVLGNLPMFAGLDKPQRLALSKCTDVERFKPDAILFREGDQAEGFFILKQGRVKMRKISPNGHEVVLHLSRPPHMIGCRALTWKGSSYPADAVAVDEVEALRFTRDRFLKAVSDVPDVFFGLLIDMNRRLGEIYTLQSALLEPVEQRIANLLMHQALPPDVEAKDWSKHPLQEVRLTKSMIGSIVGTTTETAIRVLSKWKKEGWIRSGRGSIRLVQPEAISQLCQGSALEKNLAQAMMV
ncbi:MAG: Crp/Fnr family transcriptional regulator [Acidobacteria bacterium]|nr:Crp/Fnr family transcriptional regulator [Acidobacteriota bacterium]